MRIDHVIYATRDLDAAAAEIEAALGLASVAGGRHEGLGTHNRIVPLGDGYVELMAIADPREAASSELGKSIEARLERSGDGPWTWCVEVEDVEAVAARLGTSVMTIAREGLTARLTGLVDALRDPGLPFFITRDEGVRDPGEGANAGGITWIEVTTDRDRLSERLGHADLPVRVAAGSPGVNAVGIGGRELRNG